MPARKFSSELRARWQQAYDRALQDFGSAEQAERIAWGAIDQAATHERMQGRFEGLRGAARRSGAGRRATPRRKVRKAA